MQSRGDGAVQVLQKEVENVDVDAPVLLDLLQAEEARFGAVFSKAPGEA